MVYTSPPLRGPPRPTRVSVACAPCRSQHVKCDAIMPSCARCLAEGNQCVYPKSRRGRPRRNVASTLSSTTPRSVIRPATSFSTAERITSHNSSGDGLSSEEIWISEESDGLGSCTSEQLFLLYYSFFHDAHPCLLPRQAMERYLASDGEELQLLSSVMQYIGSLFASVSSESLKIRAEHLLATVRTPNFRFTPFDVQAVLLYSIAVYWCDELDESNKLLDEVIRMALDLGMNHGRYAVEHGRQDPVLEESWRRTWWQIYITDAHIAGSTQSYPFRTSHVEMDVYLPCEEQCYTLGNIPRPRTLGEYAVREFMDYENQEFSSFAELVGLTKVLDLALAPLSNSDLETLAEVSSNVDAAVTAWSSLLPSSKKCLKRLDGTFDEALFKANAIINVYTAGLHRQLSTLAYSPIEVAARCPPPTAAESLRRCGTPDSQLHTSKVLFALEQFNELLMLPTNIATHTPFIICMIASITKTQLAACRCVYSGQQLQLCRERIRVNMGSLKTLGEYWPLGKRTYQELGLIAREILFPEASPLHDVARELESFLPIDAVESFPIYLPEPDNPSGISGLYDMGVDLLGLH